MKFWRIAAAIVAAGLLLAPAPALAQGGSTITGVVRDTSGGVLPGVTVEAASPALIEKVRTAVTDAEGLYRLVDLRPGDYTVTFTLAGFNTFRRSLAKRRWLIPRAPASRRSSSAKRSRTSPAAAGLPGCRRSFPGRR
jgi:hypothetical protein